MRLSEKAEQHLAHLPRAHRNGERERGTRFAQINVAGGRRHTKERLTVA